jgi:hypothetical protein
LPLVALPLFVHLSSERMLEPVRRDSFFAEKRESHPARLLIVQLESVGRDAGRARSGAKAVVTVSENGRPER